jgi:hypothetical protein
VVVVCGRLEVIICSWGERLLLGGEVVMGGDGGMCRDGGGRGFSRCVGGNGLGVS